MVEDQVDDAAVIATYRATAACLVNQNPLHLLKPPSDGLTDAALA
jgi:hypothetical protein